MTLCGDSVVMVLEWLLNYTLNHMQPSAWGCSLALIYPIAELQKSDIQDCTIVKLLRSPQLKFSTIVTSPAKLLSLEKPDHIGVSYKFHPYCQIVISDYSVLSQNVENYQSYFKHIFKSYYIVFQNQEKVKNITRNLAHLPNLILMNIQEGHRWRNPVSHSHMETPDGSFPLQFSFYCIFCREVNWHRKSLIIQVTKLEILAFENFKRTRLWISYTANIFHEVAQLLNATLKINTVQRSGAKEDLYIQPLIEGRSHLCSVREEATSTTQIYYSSVVYYDSLMFITATPKVKASNSLFILIEPFSPSLWLAIVASLLFTAFTAILHLSYKTGRILTIPEIVVVTWVFIGSMVKLAADQQLKIHSYKVLSNTKQTMFVLCIWFLSIIILSCGYKSKIISEIITPRVEQPPKTFEELAESGFSKNVMIVADQEPLPTWDTPVGRKIKREWRKYSFVDDTCYKEALKPKSVCIGWGTFFHTLGRLYLTGAKGEKLFSLSDNDGLMSVKGALGVSKQFPQLLAVINKIAEWQTESGMRTLCHRLRNLFYSSRGKASGKNLVPSSKYYDIYNARESNYIAQFKQRNLGIRNWIFQVLVSCYTGSLVVFIIELIRSLIIKFKIWKRNRTTTAAAVHEVTVQYYTFISVQQRK